MKERIAHICSELPNARIFADIGCDHGYCTQYMLQNDLCEKAYISDISAKSLEKAEKLLEKYVAAERCIPVVANGLEGIPEPCDLVLIAGLGGEEMIAILEKYPLPAQFLLQPMKNADKLRAFLLARGAKIERDYTFSEGAVERKYYNLIFGYAEGGDVYTERELRYGRDNLGPSSPPAFVGMMKEELEKLKERMQRPGMKEENHARLVEQYRETEEIIHAIEGNL